MNIKELVAHIKFGSKVNASDVDFLKYMKDFNESDLNKRTDSTKDLYQNTINQIQEYIGEGNTLFLEDITSKRLERCKETE